MAKANSKQVPAKPAYRNKRNGVFLTVPPGLWKRVRIAAATQEKKINEYVVGAIEGQMARDAQGAA